MADRRIVIVGASVAGITCAETLRADGFTGPITVLGAETEQPYNRPPLSKHVLTGGIGAAETRILPAGDLSSIDVDLRLGVAATGLDLPGRRVLLADEGHGAGDLAFDELVVATGVRPRRLHGVRRLPGVHELRTLDDALRLRAELVPGARVVVVGSGILGSETAAAARALGADVTLVGRSDALRLGQAGSLLSPRLIALHRSHGVRLRLGADVRAFVGAERVRSVELSDGEVVPADVVVTAVGCVPAVEWLASAGLDLADGVVCDEHGAAAPGVWAIGDVAAWRDPATGVAARAEHQLGAIEQAQAVAHLLATGTPSPRPLPFFWSELFGARIQAYGTFAGGGPLVTVAGDDASGTAADRFVAESRTSDGRVAGVIGWNSPREFRQARGRVGTHPVTTSDLVGATKGSPA
jgi:NADPH-dependent 2,4-dienoyl-CoA reductase/sulfur reductase-like enzyme